MIGRNIIPHGNGSAVYVSGGNGSISIYASVIEGNSIQEEGNGGAVYVDGSNTSLSLYQSVIEKKPDRKWKWRCCFFHWLQQSCFDRAELCEQ